MYYISPFCCACLKNDKSQVNLKKTQVEIDSLIQQLKICVSEVEWSKIETTMCESCEQKLNAAFEFKQQCLKSARTLQNYILQLSVSSSQTQQVATDISIRVARNEVKQEYLDEYISITKESEELQKQLYLRLKPTNHLYPSAPTIVTTNNVNNENQNPQQKFPNIFFNFIPANAIAYPNNNNIHNPNLLFNGINNHPLRPPCPSTIPPLQLSEQNGFFDMNRILHKMPPFSNRVESRQHFLIHPQAPPLIRHHLPIRIPVPLPNPKLADDINISQLLTESNPEEVSVEIDPTCFDYASDWEYPTVVDEHNKHIKPNDTTKYIPNIPVPPLTKLVELNNSVQTQLNLKQTLPSNIEDKLLDFLSVDHFMVPKTEKTKMVCCEQCGQLCDSIKSLHFHTNQIHKGKFPYSCRECLTVYVLSSEYKSHVKKCHTRPADLFLKDVITLKDLSLQNEAFFFPPPIPPKQEEKICDIPKEREEVKEYKCGDCPKVFYDAHAISQHTLKKHSELAKKKYFIKGMKNAKCDICNREFSTQSYLQLHVKLHNRQNAVKHKVLNKKKYKPLNKDLKVEDVPVVNSDADEKVKTPPRIVQDEKPESPKSQKGIKITINLKNLKESLKELQNEAQHNGLSDSDSPMEVDSSDQDQQSTPSLVNGEIECDQLPLVLELNDTEDCQPQDVSFNCDELHDENSDLLLKDIDSPEKLQSPSKYKLVDGKPQCSFCLKLFSRKHDLKRHINNIHLRAIQYVCHLCNTPFYEAFHLTRHLRQHYCFVRCCSCLKEFSILRDLKLHITSTHDDSAQMQCGTCGEIFTRLKYLQKHMCVHDKDIFYKCHICNLELKESRELSRHLVEHSGMFSCHVCQSSYSTDYELCNHMKNHSADSVSERKYECEVCHNRYKKRRYLVNHMNNVHFNDKQQDS